MSDLLPSLSPRFRRSGSLLAVLAAAGLLTGCSDLLRPAPPAPASLALSLSLATDAGTAAAYRQANQVRIRLSRPGAQDSVRQLSYPPAGNEVRLSVELTQAQETAQLVVELLRDNDLLFRADTSVVLRARETTDAPVNLHAVPARVRVEEPASEIQSLGETLQLSGAVLFATGEPIPGLALSYQALDAGVVEVSPAGAVVSRAEGEARVVGRYGNLADTVWVRVRAVVASVEAEPATAELQVGETLQLTAVLRDARGNALSARDAGGNLISGRAVSWSSSRLTVAQVDEQTGQVSAVAPDTVTVTATTSEGRSGSATLSIRPLPPGVTGCAVSQVTATGATLTCRIDPNQALTSVRFEWGPDASLGNTSTPRSVSGSTVQEVSETLVGLSPNSAYSWRVVASSAGGETASEIQSFTTAPQPTFTLTVAGGGTGNGTLTSTPAGIDCVRTGGSNSGTCSASFAEGTTVTLTAAPAGGHSFTGWSGACSGTGTCTVSMTRARSVTASFAAPQLGALQLTISGLPSGAAANVTVTGPNNFTSQVTSSTTLQNLALGTYTITAGNVTSGGVTYIASPTTQQAAVTTSTTRSATVTYSTQLQLHTLSVGGAGLGSGTVTSDPAGINCTITNGVASGTCQASFTSGTQVELTATPEPENGFSGWSGACSGTGSTCAILMSRPQSVTASFISPFAQVALGQFHSCALTNTGRAYCWGSNADGQLGTGNPISSSTPVPVAGGLTFTAISAGARHTCALTPNGQAYCWGSNVEGRLGRAGASSSTPVPVAGNLSFTALSAGDDHTCALTGAGRAYCWGRNVDGQLGRTGGGNAVLPVAGVLTFASLSAGSFHTCARTSAGAAYCWGSNEHGQLGIGSEDRSRRFQPEPVQMPSGVAGFASLHTGWYNTCALTGTGVAYCWGNNATGQVGDGTTTRRIAPVAVAGNRTFSALSLGQVHSCGLTTAGAAFCWGWNGQGRLGRPGPASLTPVEVAGGLTFASLSAGLEHTCARTTTDQAYCWGRNNEGQLGDGSQTDRSVPVPVRQ